MHLDLTVPETELLLDFSILGANKFLLSTRFLLLANKCVLIQKAIGGLKTNREDM